MASHGPIPILPIARQGIPINPARNLAQGSQHGRNISRSLIVQHQAGHLRSSLRAGAADHLRHAWHRLNRVILPLLLGTGIRRRRFGICLHGLGWKRQPQHLCVTAWRSYHRIINRHGPAHVANRAPTRPSLVQRLDRQSHCSSSLATPRLPPLALRDAPPAAAGLEQLGLRVSHHACPTGPAIDFAARGSRRNQTQKGPATGPCTRASSGGWPCSCLCPLGVRLSGQPHRGHRIFCHHN